VKHYNVEIVSPLMQRYIQQHNEVELSALGMGTSFSQPKISLLFVFNLHH